MAQRFEPVIKRARFEVPGYSPQQMIAIANPVAKSVGDRILSALDLNDTPALPLKPGYSKWKARKYPPAVRNWSVTGVTLRSLKTLEATHNRAVIGFTSGWSKKTKKGTITTNAIVAINQSRQRQFGLSPRDRIVFVSQVNALEPVKVSNG
jgi:hypothetical protein